MSILRRGLSPSETAEFELLRANSEKIAANIDYIAMMSDIELEEETYESEISQSEELL